jgi:hypothetical protein
VSGKKLNVFCSEVDRRGARTKVRNSWVYWRENGTKLVLRADAQGIVLRHTSGPADQPSSYQTPFETQEGVQVRVAYNTEASQLDEPRIAARLADFQVKQSLSASLAKLGPIFVPPSGSKQKVTVLPLAEIRLEEYHRFKRAVVATLFGGRSNDVQARNMDKFLRLNYGKPGDPPKEFKGTHDGKPIHELRRSVAASGPNPIDIIHDIGTAAQAVRNDDANLRVVDLVLHGNTDRIGRRDPGIFLLDSDLRNLESLKGERKLRQRAVDRAQERLKAAQKNGDPEDIAAAREEVKSRQDNLNDLNSEGGMPLLQAFDQAATDLEKAQIDLVELQACGTAGSQGGVAALGFLSRLERLLSTPGHKVDVKGHSELIFSNDDRNTNTVFCWLGTETDQGKPGTQTSNETLPVP